jgi:predicted dehydrogenase
MMSTTPQEGSGWGSITRRGWLKSLASLPVVGVFFYNVLKKKTNDDRVQRAILDELGVAERGPAIIPEAISRPPSDRVRVGIIGFGYEGEALVRNAGYAHPDWIQESRDALRENPGDRRLETYVNQDDLNIEFTGVCDLFDVRAERAIAASQTDLPSGGAAVRPAATRYRRYTDMLDSGQVDAVIVATPDHWHSRITLDAAARGIHVYCEKCMSRTEDEAHQMYDAVRDSGIVFQLGHQNRQSESHNKAREVIASEILGPITLVEGTTNRNTPWGAWVWDIHEDGNPDTIDWEQFQEPAPTKMPYNAERFFRWRCWFDYGTGLAGDLLSHEYDAVNQILECGIPHSAVASGGVYYFDDGRDVPDVFQVAYEYPDRDMTLLYSATLANGAYRGLQFMGHDATMEVSGTLSVSAERDSTRYADKIESKIIDPDRPMFTYRPGFRGIDAVTSATEQYFASRGLLYTYRGGRRVSAYHLMVKDWLDCIRYGGTPSCNIELGFQEAITCHMATRSLQEGRRVTWDPVARRIV